MLGLPRATEVKRQLPKSAIYRKFAMNTAAREKFDADISRIDIVNEISPANTTLAAGESISSFFVLLVTLKRAEYDKKNIVLLSKLIEQNMLFVLRFEDQARLAVFHSRLLQGDWAPVDSFAVTLTGLNLDTVWENLLSQVGNVTMEPGRTLDEQLAVDERQAKLQKQIEQLERKARAEKQPKKKFELHQQILKLKQEEAK